MSELGHALGEMAQRLFARELGDDVMRSARAGVWPEVAWEAVVEQGLLLALVDGERGFGVPLADGLALIRELGCYVVPLPLAETMVANMVLARADLPIVHGVVGLVPDEGRVTLRQDGAGWTASGEADRIAWGGNADALLIEADGRIALMTSHFLSSQKGCNLAAMPRDRMTLDGPANVAPLAGCSLLEAGALIRALAMAGAMQTLVGMTVEHTAQRTQFGRPLSGFQVVQHGLARLAGEAAAASAAADLAAEAFAAGSPRAGTAIAAARARIGEAAGIATAIAHQLHGAIGFTEEHRLHRFTAALWSWRDEFGTAAWWTRRLGAEAISWSAPAYWPSVASV